MQFEKSNSGLILPKQQPAKPIEHPVCGVIRNALLRLADELAAFEQTTHGRLGPNEIEDVAECLEKCYREQDAYSVSNLSQVIVRFVKEQEGE